MSVEAAMLKNRPSYLEPVRETPLPERHLVVLTFNRHDPFLLRPFLTFVKNERTGETSNVGDYTCVASALHAHDALVTALTKKMERRTTAPSDNTRQPNPQRFA